ncbi:TIR domain-containing protein [Actinomadura sp. DC4]|uniref:TIR domain-containing protein n=1 Tax=Actinomadura sp. DC4 TaxID=3055069 RepID=UPI0025B057FF|nr:TIR domain-containing protein [Actinomadura sp. DC4]MDN3353769.1 TIR domain-containing protein [Actinomadura sp. DC4]
MEAALSLTAKMLHISSVEELARSLISRAMLVSGRFEAHEFGRNQHSSASAGGFLIGISGIRGIRDEVVRPVVDGVLGLLDADGSARGHDNDASAGRTSWTESQLLFGLLCRPHLVTGEYDLLRGLAGALLAKQHSGGGWPLREGEDPEFTFAFYPALALSRAYRTGVRQEEGVRVALAATAHYLENVLHQQKISVEEAILGYSALERVYAVIGESPTISLRENKKQILESAWDAEGGLRLQDRLIIIYRQPAWHSLTWHPLLYLCLRRWSSPLAPVNALLGAELLDGFSPSISAWPGPVGGVRHRSGASWASALALKATVHLARDLMVAGVSEHEYRERVGSLQSDGYEYDIAISFAGADRSVAENITRRLEAAGLRVFYDRDHQHELLGEDLAMYLQVTYMSKSRFAIVLVSEAFKSSSWAGNWEWKAVLARMQRQRTGYVLPYIMEEVMLPGLSPTLGFVSSSDYSPDEFSKLVVRKVRAAGG